jgi:peptide/nickel transport system substrate-binding protein
MVRILSLISAAFVLLSGCAPTAPSQSGTAAAPPAAPKILTIAETREPATLYGFTGEGGSGGGAGIAGGVMHDTLAQIDAFDHPHASLAAEVPSVAGGTWRINPDGTMDVTWKLKPGVTWQDGAPFTSEDLMFTLMLNKDRDLNGTDASTARVMESATNPDPLTFNVHWSRVDVLADTPRALAPIPQHLLGDTFRADKSAFLNSAFFREQFVGLGPYRMTSWERGSFIDATRYDGYHGGKPGLDRVVIKYIGDPNTMVANILAGSIDVILPKSLELDTALQVKRQWEGTGNLVRVEALPRIAYLELMLRPEYAKPTNGFTNVLVRQGLYHAVDRAGISEVASGGLGPLADSWYDPNDPLRRDMESSISKYPLDLNRAQALLTQAGWTRGADGLLANAAGDRFSTEVWINPQGSNTAGTILVDNWKAVGVDAKLHEIPSARAQDREYTATRPGPLVTGVGTAGFGLMERYDSRDFASAANQWAGRNRAGYVNRRADEILDTLKATIDGRERIPLLQEQMRIFTTELPLIPLYWEPGNMLAVKGVKADIHPNAPSFQLHTWTRE